MWVFEAKPVLQETLSKQTKIQYELFTCMQKIIRALDPENNIFYQVSAVLPAFQRLASPGGSQARACQLLSKPSCHAN